MAQDIARENRIVVDGFRVQIRTVTVNRPKKASPGRKARLRAGTDLARSDGSR